jgi:hypothetical protein
MPRLRDDLCIQILSNSSLIPPFDAITVQLLPAPWNKQQKERERWTLTNKPRTLANVCGKQGSFCCCISAEHTRSSETTFTLQSGYNILPASYHVATWLDMCLFRVSKWLTFSQNLEHQYATQTVWKSWRVSRTPPPNFLATSCAGIQRLSIVTCRHFTQHPSSWDCELNIHVSKVYIASIFMRLFHFQLT